MKSFFKVSTSTLGGAIIMLILTVLLGDKAPWFIDKLTVNTSTNVSIDVDKVFDSKNDPSEIHKNKDYYVDDSYKYYINIPSEQWKVSSENPGRFLDGLSAADVPFFKNSLKIFKAAYGIDTIKRNELTSTTVYNPNDKHIIGFPDSARISNYPIELNPYKDINVVKSTMNASIKAVPMLSLMMDSLNSSEIDEVQATLVKQQDETNKALKPKPQTFYDNVTITTIQPELLNRSAIYKSIFSSNGLNLFTIQSILTILNPELFSANVNKFVVSKKNNAVLMDTSTDLRNITVDGRLYPDFELTRLVLIAVKKDMIYVVTMRYLNGAGNTSSYSREIESMFNSFRLIN